jgi:hypothetical protein
LIPSVSWATERERHATGRGRLSAGWSNYRPPFDCARELDLGKQASEARGRQDGADAAPATVALASSAHRAVVSDDRLVFPTEVDVAMLTAIGVPRRAIVALARKLMSSVIRNDCSAWAPAVVGRLPGGRALARSVTLGACRRDTLVGRRWPKLYRRVRG